MSLTHIENASSEQKRNARARKIGGAVVIHAHIGRNTAAFRRMWQQAYQTLAPEIILRTRNNRGERLSSPINGEYFAASARLNAIS